MFSNGNKVYKTFDKDYTKHKRGYVIIAPPGTGKSYFVRNQNKDKKKDFIDGDILLSKLGVNWKLGKFPDPDFILSYKRADLMLEQSRQYGYRILTSTIWEFNGDALVLPKLKDHKKLVEKRKDLNWKDVQQLRKRFEWFAKKYFKIPIFETFDEAIEYLNKKNQMKDFQTECLLLPINALTKFNICYKLLSQKMVKVNGYRLKNNHIKDSFNKIK